MEDDLTLGGGHAVQYTDYHRNDIVEMYTWSLYDLSNRHPNKFNKNKKINKK